MAPRWPVEEALRSVSCGIFEITINSSWGTSCYVPVPKDERYILVVNHSSAGHCRIGGCDPFYKLLNNVHMLDALRNRSKEGPTAVVGTVFGSPSHRALVLSATITAEAAEVKRTKQSDAAGHYRFEDLPPGRYTLAASKDGFVSDGQFNIRWTGHYMPNPKDTSSWKPDPDPNLLVLEKYCVEWDMGLRSGSR